MEPDDLTVDPGSQVTTKVTVRNLGTRVEEFDLLVQGPGAAFATVVPATVSIYPDVEQRAVVRFAPARGPQSPAGVNTFEVVARSAVHADVSDVARGRLTVTAFEDLQAVLKPDASRGRKPGRHLVSVTNGGNTPVSSQVAFTDQDRVLTFEPPGTAVSLQPGGTVDVPVLLNGPRRWFGRTERLPFAAVVSPTGSQPPITLNGVRQQTAVFPWWAPPAALAAVAVAIAVMALLIPWLNRTPTVPVIGAVDQTAAVKQLTEADYVPEPIIRGDDKVPKGLTISTDPAGGAPLKRGERVKLFISSGECAQGPCPVEVPSVEGLPVSEAQAKLEEKKFTVRIDRVPSEDRALDRVIDSEPKATTLRPPGTDVRLTVSTGPPTNPAEQAAADKAAADKAAADEKAAADKKAADEKAAADKKAADEKAAADKAAADKAAAEKVPVPVPVPVPVLVQVPDLTAQSVEDATKALTDLKLKAKTETVHSNAVPEGQVLSTKPAKDDKVAPGSEVKLNVAKNTTPVDLIVTADQASWTDKAGKELTVADKDSGKAGVAQAEAKDGSTVLVTTPAPGDTITGTYTLSQAVVPGDHLLAQIGLLKDKSTADKSTPSTPVNLDPSEVTVIIKANNNSTPIKTAKINSSTLQKIDVDLTPAKGATKINISVKDTRTNPGTTPQQAAWQKLRLEPKVG